MNIEKITDIFSEEEVIHALLVTAVYDSEYRKKLFRIAKESTSSDLLEKLAIEAVEHTKLDTDLIAQIWNNKNCSIDTYLKTGPMMKEADEIWEAFEKISLDVEKLTKIAQADTEGDFDYVIPMCRKEINIEIYEIIMGRRDWLSWACFFENPNLSEELFEYIIKDIHKVATEKDKYHDFSDDVVEQLVRNCEERFLKRIMKAIYKENNDEATEFANELYKYRMGKPFKVH